MLQKLINLIKHFWSLRRQFAKYFIVGISGVILDMASLIMLKEWVGLAPTVAVIINQAVLLGYVFYLNKHWSFRDKQQSHEQVVRFLILAGFNYCFSLGAMFWFNHRLNFDYRLVRLGSIAMMVSWNFFLYKYWVYSQSTLDKHFTTL